jgi:predicted DNA-binding protein YlxM (UPF0122 family)
MIAMRRAGLKLREIGAKFGISRQRVHTVLRQNAERVTERTSDGVRKDIGDMIAMRRAGLTLQEIGTCHGISRQAVHVLLGRHGPPELEKQALEAQRQAKEATRPQWRDARGRPLFPPKSRTNR